MLASERRHRVLELVRLRGGFASLPELAKELQVSQSTLRRDLEHLERTGVARRTRGGVLYTGSFPGLPHFQLREPAQWEKKRAIARAAAALIQNGDTLLLDGGSTTYELARLLVGRPLQIVTNSLPVANLFAANAFADLVLVGGIVYPRTGVALGSMAIQMLQHINVRRSLLSVAGINERGFFNSNLLLVETERAMMQAADEVIVLADSTKFGHKSLAFLAPLERVDCIVADEELSPKWQERIRRAGVRLVLAPLEPEEKAAEEEQDAKPPKSTSRKKDSRR